jgi:DNA-binding transcriptional regulator YhcF (GntR family)
MAHSSALDKQLELVRTDDVPIGVNLAWRLQTLIESGQLPARTQLPGVRDLASGVGVNTNTARSVYRRLEDDGFAVSRHGSGTYVAPYVTVAPTLEQFAAQVTTDAMAQGIDPRQLARAIYAGTGATDPLEPLIESDPGASPAPEDERVARASLRAQIARLEASLAPYPETATALRGPKPIGPRPHLAELGELETIRDDLVERLKQARVEAERRGEQQKLARSRLEDAIADPSSHRWEIGKREDMGEPGCGRWQVRPAWGPVGALMNWWRVKISSGCP